MLRLTQILQNTFNLSKIFNPKQHFNFTATLVKYADYICNQPNGYYKNFKYNAYRFINQLFAHNRTNPAKSYL